MITRGATVLFVSALFLTLLPVLSVAGDLPGNLAELSARRDLWPEEVTCLKGAQFQNGRSIRKGQVVKVAEVKPDGVRLDDGVMYFMFPEQDTDIMKRVAELAAALTPEQLALTLDDVRRRTELWPELVTLKYAMTVGGGTEVPAGQQLVVMGFEANGSLSVGAIEQNTVTTLDPWDTDLFARARERAGLADPGAVPFLYRSLETMLEPATNGSKLTDFDYIVMYDGRDSCPRATQFAPELAAFQNETSTADVKWELILVNSAHVPQQNRAHYANMGLKGRAAKDGWGGAVHQLFGIGGYMTPWIHVFDREAVELATVSADAVSTSPQDVLGVLADKVQGQ